MQIPTPSLTGFSFVGSTRTDRSETTFHAFNPATGEQLEPACHAATTEDLETAVRLADEAAASFGAIGGLERAAFLRRIADNIEATGDQLIERMVAETGLPEARARNERARTTGQLRMFADLVEEGSWVQARIDHADLTRTPVPKPDTRWMLRPLGPVAVFGPANFPLAFSVAGGDTASAFAAGCPVVVKAHSSHPGTSELVGAAVAQAVQECGLHAGVFSLLFGSGKELGAALVQHPSIKAVGFTGSKTAGRKLFDLASARPEPIPVFAEMSSINPVFILPDKLATECEKIAEGLHASITLGVGQFCTNPGLILLETGTAAEKLIHRLGELLGATAPGVMLNRGTLESYGEGLERLRDLKEVKVITGGEAGAARACAALFQTTANVFLREQATREEVFGPASLVVTGSKEELFEIARQIEGQLTATIHGTDADLEEWRALLQLLEKKTGRLIFNGYPTGVEVCASMNHSGPYPATTDCRFTSVGTAAIYRFARPVCYQNSPQRMLPEELRDDNPRGIWRLMNNRFSKE